MKVGLPSVAATRAVAILSLLAGCAGTNTTPPDESAGSGPGGQSTSGAGGVGAAGSSAQGLGGMTAGLGGGGAAAGQGTGGAMGGAGGTGGLGGGVGGQNTAGLSGGGLGGVGGQSAGSGGTAAGSSGSGGSGGDAIPATFATFKEIMIGTNPPCVASDCHGAGGPNPLQMPTNDDDQLYTNLTTVMVKECGNIPVVTPGNPEQSALVKLLNGPCGDLPRMPKGCIEDEFSNNCVPAEYIDAVERWVAAGAPRQ